jgi:hypothetical protein
MTEHDEELLYQRLTKMRKEMNELRRHSNLLQRIVAEQSAQMAAMWEAMQAMPRKKTKLSP